MKIRPLYLCPILLAFVVFTGAIYPATPAETATSRSKKKKKKKPAPKPAASVAAPAKPLSAKVVSQTTSKRFTGSVAGSSKTFRPKVRRSAYNPWVEPTYADSTIGDNVDGEDLDVRRAAVEALGPLNGSVVVSDPQTGRILAIVNQKLAYTSGFQPCSTVKVPVALAALSESIVERDTPLRVYGRTSFNMTTAIAKSNNQYFASLGEKLGFDRVSYYARLFGLGEK